MRTYLECYPCFLRQALEAARSVGLPDEESRDVLVEVGALMGRFSLDMKPPEMAGRIRDIVLQRTGVADPYREAKRRHTHMALELLPSLRERVEAAEDPLRAAVLLAVIGNIIDLGSFDGGDIRGRLSELLGAETRAVEQESPELFRYDAFRGELSTARTLLYVGDNAGETVFDRLLIEEIRRSFPSLTVTYAVRQSPILNDAVLEDAEQAGLNRVAELIPSGSEVPGTLLSRCTPEFRRLFTNADIVISKGQGNYETLSDTGRCIYFLLMAKCPVIARDVGCSVGDVLLLRR
jgi:damage-control phosphatase, subfamily I